MQGASLFNPWQSMVPQGLGNYNGLGNSPSSYTPSYWNVPASTYQQR
jgi:hypothetical protein